MSAGRAGRPRSLCAGPRGAGNRADNGSALGRQCGYGFGGSSR
jgi:hypothetical protein